MRSVQLSRRASREWRELVDRLAAHNPTAPADFAADLSRTFQAITIFPRGLPEVGRGLRRAVLQNWSVGIYYRLSRNRIMVIAVIDLRRDPFAIRSRLGLHEDVPEFGLGPSPASAVSAVEIRTVPPFAAAVPAGSK